MLSTVLMMRRTARPKRALSKTTAVTVPRAARGRRSLFVAGGHPREIIVTYRHI